MVVLALLALCAAAPLCLCQGGEVPPEVPVEWIHAVWIVATVTPIGMLVAFATCIAGYSSKTPPENFSLADFFFTLLMSLGIGVATLYAGWSYGDIVQWLANGFLTWYFWKVAKIAAGIITKKLGYLPAQAGPPVTAH